MVSDDEEAYSDSPKICDQVSHGVVQSIIVGTLDEQINRIFSTFLCYHTNSGDEHDCSEDEFPRVGVFVVVQEFKETEYYEKEGECGDDVGQLVVQRTIEPVEPVDATSDVEKKRQGDERFCPGD